jgi:hypothetical protein
MATTQVRLRPARIASGALLLGTATLVLLLMGKSLSNTPGASWLAFLLGLALMPMMASPIEWLVHRYVYHRVALPALRPLFEVHHRVHHYVYFPTWRYVTGGEPRRIPVFSGDHDQVHTGALANALVRLSHFTFYMLLAAVTVWLPTWLVARSVPLLVGTIAASVVVSDLMVTVHDTIHRPSAHRWMERQHWFQLLDRHHYIHHVDTEANVNFLLPLADWLFGTLRTSMTAEELARHGTWEDAKAIPIGQGEPAREAVRAHGRPPRPESRAVPAARA